MIKIFYDTETTGTNHFKHCIHQLAGLVEVDGEVVEEFDIRMAPHPKAIIDPVALSVCGKTEAEIRAYPDFKIGKANFCKMLEKYIDKYDKKSKAYLVGFNNLKFDNEFLRMLFDLSGDQFFASWFYADSHDTMSLASVYLQDRRADMPSFKLKRVAFTLGIGVDENGLHDALFDAKLTRDIYRIVTGLEIEI